MKYRSTKCAAEALGVNPSRLQRIIWENRIVPPEKIGGSFAWNSEDINRASNVLLHRPYKPEESVA